jgi:hypothetical protein
MVSRHNKKILLEASQEAESETRRYDDEINADSVDLRREMEAMEREMASMKVMAALVCEEKGVGKGNESGEGVEKGEDVDVENFNMGMRVKESK